MGGGTPVSEGETMLRHARVVPVLLMPLILLGCPREQASPDGGRKGSVFYENVKQGLTVPVLPRTDAGPGMVVFAPASSVNVWAVNRRALKEVLWAVHLNSGEQLAKALEKQAAVPPELVAHARAVRGREPLSEPAEAALKGPLSLPFGGLHAPVKLEDTGLTSQASLDCRDTLLRPGAVGQVLPGIGRSRVVMLLDGEDLKRFQACVEKTPLPPDATPAVAQERTRLTALLEQGRKEEVAILMALGSDD
jgi:hypothetical protein